MASFLLPLLESTGAFFFGIYSGKLVELLEVNLSELLEPPCDRVPPFGVFNSQFSALSLQQLVDYRSGFSVPAPVPKQFALRAPASVALAPWVLVCLSRLVGKSLPCILCSLADSSRVGCFTVFSFLLVRLERQASCMQHWKVL